MELIYNKIITNLLNEGFLVIGGKSPSIGSEREFYEILNFSITIEPGIIPILPHKVSNFKIHLSIGRLLWMLRGSNSLSEIEYYDKNVAFFSDDGKEVPGSSFGHRMFTKNGNQLDQIIRRLQADNSSRRCIISIYDSFDNFRESRDIPCLLFLAFHLRENRLHLTIQMRSNNAFRLFLYNFFELSFIQGIVSFELGIEPGNIFYNALSMHLYLDDKEQAELYLNHNVNQEYECSFPKLCFNGHIYSLKELQNLEFFIRTESINTIMKDFKLHKNKYKEILGSFYDYYLILLHFKLIKTNNVAHLNEIKDCIDPFYQNLL